MKLALKLIFSSLALMFVSSASDVLAQERNVISSCRMMSSSGAYHLHEERGKCVIKTRVEGDYIVVNVKVPWQTTGSSDILRLANNPLCTSWSYMNSEGCSSEYWYGTDTGWSYGGAWEEVDNGRIRFKYSLGNAYLVEYHGPLPRP